MKDVFLLLLIFSTVWISLEAQSSKEPFKKANTILIETEGDGEDAYKQWGRHLAQNGYSIDNSDDTFLTLTTGPKDTSKYNYAFILISTVMDNGTIILTMKWQLKSSILSGTSSTEFYDWEYRTSKGNALNIIHGDVLPTIQSFQPVSITYELR